MEQIKSNICESLSYRYLKQRLLEIIRSCPDSIFNICSSVSMNYLTRLQVVLNLRREHIFVITFGIQWSFFAILAKISKLQNYTFYQNYTYTSFSAVNISHMQDRPFWHQSSIFKWKIFHSEQNVLVQTLSYGKKRGS